MHYIALAREFVEMMRSEDVAALPLLVRNLSEITLSYRLALVDDDFRGRILRSLEEHRDSQVAEYGEDYIGSGLDRSILEADAEIGADLEAKRLQATLDRMKKLRDAYDDEQAQEIYDIFDVLSDIVHTSYLVDGVEQDVVVMSGPDPIALAYSYFVRLSDIFIESTRWHVGKHLTENKIDELGHISSLSDTWRESFRLGLDEIDRYTPFLVSDLHAGNFASKTFKMIVHVDNDSADSQGGPRNIGHIAFQAKSLPIDEKFLPLSASYALRNIVEILLQNIALEYQISIRQPKGNVVGPAMDAFASQYFQDLNQRLCPPNGFGSTWKATQFERSISVSKIFRELRKVDDDNLQSQLNELGGIFGRLSRVFHGTNSLESSTDRLGELLVQSGSDPLLSRDIVKMVQDIKHIASQCSQGQIAMALEMAPQQRKVSSGEADRYMSKALADRRKQSVDPELLVVERGKDGRKKFWFVDLAREMALPIEAPTGVMLPDIGSSLGSDASDLFPSDGSSFVGAFVLGDPMQRIAFTPIEGRWDRWIEAAPLMRRVHQDNRAVQSFSVAPNHMMTGNRHTLGLPRAI